MAEGSGSRVELRLLGPLELAAAGRQVPLSAKPRALLACLALRLGEVVSADRLVDDLWGEGAPKAARHALQVYVSQLRRALGPARGVLATRPPGYALELPPHQVDTYRLAALMEDGRFREALALWRGPPLADFTYEPFAQSEIARLHELRQRCLEARIESDLALGRHADLIGELEALVAAEPLRERLRSLLMLALYRSERQAEALTVYRDARRVLVDELGIEPGPELRELEAAILRQDGALLAPRPQVLASPATKKRKLVTILFADVVESMMLASALDAETFDGVLQRYFETVEAVLARHGGTIEKFAGDSVLAAFGAPVAHEDDALRAARAAIELQAATSVLQLDVRVGIETGEVISGGASAGQRLVTGHAVGVAARLQQAAAPGEVVVGETAARLIAHAATLDPLGPLQLRGRDEPLAAFRLVGVSPTAPALARQLDAPLVGRSRELASLREWLAAGTPGAVLLVGPAGIGKSRLAFELTRDADATVLTGCCVPYGDGITYWPLKTMLADADCNRILSAASPGEIALAFRHHCEELARAQPLVLVLDDLQWAEPTFLDLVGHVAKRAQGPIFVLGLAREELLEEHPDFLAARRLTLDALEPAEAEVLADQLLGAPLLSDETRRRAVDTAEGNPLFLEQLVALAAEEGDLGAEHAIPGSIQALLAARLDRLGPGERGVLERAAVVGTEFGRDELVDLLEPSAVGTADRHLETLIGRGFVRRAHGAGFSFRHGLIQEAVYRATPKAERAALHERFADRLARGVAEEVDEVVGYHLERAYRLRAALAPVDRALGHLAADAGARLGAAGLRAGKRNDIPATVNLLGRAAELLPEDDAARHQIMCELGVALDAAGATAKALETLEAAATASDARSALRARVELAYLHLLEDPEGPAESLLDLASSSIPALETVGDDRALGRTWLVVGFVHGGILGRHAAWEEAAERALVYYRKAGWPTSTCLGQVAAALYYGPTPATQAIRRCQDLLADDSADRIGEAHLHVFLGGLEAMQGQIDEGRRSIARVAASYEELGQAGAAAVFCGAVRGDLELLAGDDAAAEQTLIRICGVLEGMKNRHDFSTRAVDLAEALYRQGRYDDAQRWTDAAADNAAPYDLGTQPLLRAVKAKIAARRGDLLAAERLALEAVELADRTGALNRRARVRMDLGEVLRLGGQAHAARDVVEEAARLYERKENVVGASRARALLGAPALV